MRRRPTTAAQHPTRRPALVISAVALAAGILLAGCARSTVGTTGASGTGGTTATAGTTTPTGSSVGSTTTVGPSTAADTTTADTTTAGTSTTVGTVTTQATCAPAPAMRTTVAGDHSDEDWDEPALTVTWTANAWGAPQVSGPNSIVIYSDGTVLAVHPGASSTSLPRVLRGELGSCQLAALLGSAGRMMGQDYGDPAITDQGTTLVSFRDTDGAESSLSVYALGVGDEYVTDEQRDARQALHRWLAGVRAAGDAARQPYQPTQLMLRVLDTGSDSLPRLTWPGRLGSLGADDGPDCVIIGGDDATQVRGEIGDGPTLARWDDGVSSVVLRAFVLLPGAAGCE